MLQTTLPRLTVPSAAGIQHDPHPRPHLWQHSQQMNSISIFIKQQPAFLWFMSKQPILRWGNPDKVFFYKHAFSSLFIGYSYSQLFFPYASHKYKSFMHFVLQCVMSLLQSVFLARGIQTVASNCLYCCKCIKSNHLLSSINSLNAKRTYYMHETQLHCVIFTSFN